MGIVRKQSLRNLITTYIGFGLGAINTLVLYVNFMSDTYYGFLGFILSTAFILIPFLAFGVHNTIVKFYSSFDKSDQDYFLSWMLLLPLVIIIPTAFLIFTNYQAIAGLLSSTNDIISGYVWYIFIIALSSAYFEIFFAWAKVQLKSTFGNFLKEVFHRLGVTLLLVLLALDFFEISIFIKLLMYIYLLRMIIMGYYSFKLRAPKIRLTYSKQSKVTEKLYSRRWEILKYSILIVVAGSVATLLIDIDKFMIGKYVAIENVAYYIVAIYIATVIGVPSSAMHQITYPMVAIMLNEKQINGMKTLYKKSSLSLLIISGLLFLLIICNIKSFYLVVGSGYAVGLHVVLLIGLAQLLDNSLGINNAIIYNSEYYYLVLVIGAIVIFLAIVLNILLIPRLGINGAGIATLIVTLGYSLAKLIIVQLKFNIQPFTIESIKTMGVIVILFVTFYFWDFPFHPILAIGAKGIILSSIYLILSYKLKLSLDINNAMDRVLFYVFKK